MRTRTRVPWRRVHERVLDERPGDLEHPLLVAEHAAAVSGDQLERPRRSVRETAANSSTTVSATSARSTGLASTVQLPRVRAREVEQLGRELRQPVDLLAHRRQELGARLVVQLLVGQQLEEAAEREQRRAQLVRRVGDELAARVVERREPLAHAVEGARELPDLVAALVADRLVEPARGDPLGSASPAAAAAGRTATRRRSRQRARPTSASAPAISSRSRTNRDRRDRLVQRRRDEQDGPVPGTGAAASA